MGDLEHFSVEDVFEGNFEVLGDRLALLGFSGSTAASTHSSAHAEHVEDVTHSSAAASASTVFHALHAVTIVQLTFLFVAENLVSFSNFSELK